ncbi:hypothetical protein G6F60_008125 [Rhizopus arrhizus]|uniref:Uncharacterized protein n=1 Tax=Rhizopus oryzae TaxID=64495 RepID=A0A9P6X050_RHIOR|nr:hypothetical protein G6F64_010972 [Rhizopus arrhizus]KAG1398821.1 hypothetical protein G6F60_008125 [Rhizopus arrhizus]
MYHFIRFADIGFVGNLNTYTHQDFWLRSIVIIGSLNVSVYIFDDITKAFANIRLSLAIVRPVFQVDDDGMVISTLARIIKMKDFPRMSQFFKMKFIVFKHVWEHINENEVVISRYLNVEALALQLSDIRLIVPNYSPVFVEERISRPQNDPNTNRPVSRVMRTVYSYNINVKRFEDLWEHSSLRYETLLNDKIPFNPFVVINNDSNDDNADTASHHSLTMNDK